MPGIAVATADTGGSGPVRREPNWNGRSYTDSPAIEYGP